MKSHNGMIGSILALGALALASAGCGSGSAGAAAIGSGSTGSGAPAARANSATTSDTQVATATAQATAVGSAQAVANGLQLSQDQQAQAQAIFTQLRTDVDALRTAAEAQIQALLTPAQLATLDIVRPPIALLAPEGMPEFGPGGRGGFHGPPGPPPGLGLGFGRGGGAFPPGLADALGLTDDQQTSIQAIQSDLQSAVQARRAQADSDFRAILTADQLAALDAAPRPEHGPGPGGGPGEFGRIGPRGPGQPGQRPGAGIAAVGAPANGPGLGRGSADHAVGGPRPNPLQLTDEQQTQADAIFSQLRTDSQTLISTARDQVRSTLTADQLAVLDAIDTSAAPPDHGFRGPPHPPLPAGLTESLALTDQQATTIDGLAQTLRTALTARRMQADADFRAILTADQIAQLDQFGPGRPFGPPPR